ncbi:haloacid dehalogenase type II [Pyrobaculum sp. 3827-6]|uniref:haloacid dehalogenase type II n=1 Tax=Pyrobaculum sp. 3827-6 TaxID=2983604 RepID=UPI0021D8D76D|nr:haloacid dehalogenase type II [Pyrobaculum sp. 3827-6]MCU7788884.1 haloacid dehalogenase type II [Pyrobaculum sp. 3827-6]
MGAVEFRSVRVLAFDVYGTLFDLGSLVEAARGVAPDPAGFVAMWRSKQLEYALLLSMMGRYERFRVVTERALRYVNRRLGLGLGEAEVQRLLEAWLRLRPHPDVPGALARLASRYTVVALTNGDVDMVDELLRGAGVRHHFAAILSAEEAGVFKPSPRVYGLVARLGVQLGEVALVSSNPWDAAGAANAGLKAVYVNRHGLPPEELDAAPHLVVRDLEELAAALLG